MTVLVTGGTGFIGRRLCAHLADAGRTVRVLTRDPARAAGRSLAHDAELRATPRAGDAAGWRDAVAGCDAIVNLAGESVAAGRWTDARKRAIVASRVETTRALVAGCRALAQPPPVLVSASAIGYYGPHGDEEISEPSPPGHDFLSRVCVDWEAEAVAAEGLGMRVARMRIGVVLGRGGGALARMVTPFKLYAGGPVGSGRQWVSWIHLDDVVGLLAFALARDDVRGPMNATAPDPRTMRDLASAIGAALGRPSWAPVPAFALRLALGEMAEMLLQGQRVVPRAALGAGYAFLYPKLEDALREALAGA
ncbi:MAG TPA: TIGR01777 family oxidoreductase [Candidatus Binatia bacterium]|nr:TIGR01777 family oxidoreductase [Candidatus Binatia bacterium]